MSIILNEVEWAENAINERQLGMKPVETLSRIAKYYVQKLGYKKPEARKKLELFLVSCNPNVVLVKWSDVLDRLVNTAEKYPLIVMDYVPVTETELAVVDSIEKLQEKRLAFTILCVAKYWNRAQPKNNNWVNTEDREIMKMANINTSVRRQSLMFYDMRNKGLVQYSKRVDNLNIQVMYIDDTSPEVMRIDDFRNLGNQYLIYKGEPYFKCESCGLAIKRKSNSQKYCNECASEIYVKKSVESVMRKRSE